MLRALSISRFCRKKNSGEGKGNFGAGLIDAIYIIAEINDPNFTEDLRRADVNEVVCTSAYGKNILIQSMLNHGISHVLNELLTYNEQNEFYSIDLSKPEFEKLRWKTFDELLIFLRRYNILLLGIKSAYFDESGVEIIDEDVIKELLDQDELVRQHIINPNSQVEKDRKADENDLLLVLCTSFEVIKGLAKQLKKVNV